MAKGYWSLRQMLKKRKKFARKKITRYGKFAEFAPHVRGIVQEKFSVEPKQPNSALRCCVKVRLVKNNRIVTASCKGDGAKNHINEHDMVYLQGAGGSMGGAKGDYPSVGFNVIKVGKKSLKQLTRLKNL